MSDGSQESGQRSSSAGAAEEEEAAPPEEEVRAQIAELSDVVGDSFRVELTVPTVNKIHEQYTLLL